MTVAIIQRYTPKESVSGRFVLHFLFFFFYIEPLFYILILNL